MLLQTKLPMIEERNHSDPARSLSLTAARPPASLKLVSAREEVGVCLTNEVGDENKERSLNGHKSRFELAHHSA